MAVRSSPATSLWELAERHALQHPHGLAVAGPNGRWTWVELLGRAETLAVQIKRHGLPSGAGVCLWLTSSPEWVAAFLALRRLGLTAVSIGNRAPSAELEALVSRYDARLVISQASPHGRGIDITEVGGKFPVSCVTARRYPDVAMIHLTSGSSGEPKGVLRTEDDVTEEARNVAEALALASRDAMLCATPVYHSFAFGLLTASLHSGTPCLLMDRLAPATLLDLAEREKASIIAGVPYVFQTLTALRTDRRPASLRLAVSGGAHLPRQTADAFRERFGAPLVQEYGLSEAGIVTLNLDGPPESVGAPIPNVALRIVDPDAPRCELPPGVEGEVIVRRAFPPTAYDGDTGEGGEVFTPHGVRTGDLGRLDEDGRLTLTGRIKLMINVAGAKVAPREVEDVLRTHEGVDEAVVFGVAADQGSEAVGAIVVPRRGVTVSGTELRTYCRERLSAFKVPASIEIADALPRTESGKPDLIRIRHQFRTGRQP